jgi:transcriptional regulator with XRE-family HTH domain
MARPTSRAKNPVSAALTDLRESLGDSMQEFSNRMGVALTTIGRYETSHPPTGKALRRFHALAKRYDHAPACKVFGEAITHEKEHGRRRKRKGQILWNEHTLDQAGTLLKTLWQVIEASLDPVWNESERELLMNMADLLLVGGRKDLRGKELPGEVAYKPISEASMKDWEAFKAKDAARKKGGRK